MERMLQQNMIRCDPWSDQKHRKRIWSKHHKGNLNNTCFWTFGFFRVILWYWHVWMCGTKVGPSYVPPYLSCETANAIFSTLLQGLCILSLLCNVACLSKYTGGAPQRPPGRVFSRNTSNPLEKEASDWCYSWSGEKSEREMESTWTCLNNVVHPVQWLVRNNPVLLPLHRWKTWDFSIWIMPLNSTGWIPNRWRLSHKRAPKGTDNLHLAVAAHSCAVSALSPWMSSPWGMHRRIRSINSCGTNCPKPMNPCEWWWNPKLINCYSCIWNKLSCIYSMIKSHQFAKIYIRCLDQSSISAF